MQGIIHVVEGGLFPGNLVGVGGIGGAETPGNEGAAEGAGIAEGNLSADPSSYLQLGE